MNYQKIKQYGRNATIGLVAYAMTGCANMNMQARIEGTAQNPKPIVAASYEFGKQTEKPILYAAAPLEKKVATDASSYVKREEKSWYSNKWVWIGGGLLIAGGLAAVLAGGGSKGNDTPQSTGPSPTPTPDPDPGDDNQ